MNLRQRVNALERAGGGPSAPIGRMQIFEGEADDSARDFVAGERSAWAVHIGPDAVTLYRTADRANLQRDSTGQHAGATERFDARLARLCERMRDVSGDELDGRAPSQMERLAWALTHKPFTVETMQ